MKLRRFISMMLIVTMLTVFAGCGNKDDRTQAAKKLNLSGPITVNVWYNDSAYESYLEFVARQFKKSNELVTVKPVYIEADSYINYIYDESVRNKNEFVKSNKPQTAIIKFIFNSEDIKKYEIIKKNFSNQICYATEIKIDSSAITDSSSRKGFFILNTDDEKLKKIEGELKKEGINSIL